MGQRIVTVTLAVVSGLWSTYAWAHTSGSSPMMLAPLATPSTAGSGISHEAWIVAALAVMALLIAAARRYKTLAAALVILTLWMGFEAGAHSVHHLGQPSEKSQCAVAAATAHSSAIPSEAHPCVAVLLAQAGIAGDLEPAVQAHELAATHDGRAPPRLSR